MEELIKNDLINYNMHKYNLANKKLTLHQLEEELEDMTDAVIGGSSYEINSDIHAKNKIGNSTENQALKNIDIKPIYKAKIDKIKKEIKEIELIINRTEVMLDLVDDEDSRIILKRRYFDCARINKIEYESHYSRKQIEYKIKKGIEDIARKISCVDGIKNNIR